MVRSVRSRWVTGDGVPVLVRTRPELDETFLHAGELDVFVVTDRRMLFVAFRVLVGVVVPDECQTFEGTQVKRVLPARGVGSRVGSRPKDDVLDETGLYVRVAECQLLSHPASVGTEANTIKM